MWNFAEIPVNLFASRFVWREKIRGLQDPSCDIDRCTDCFYYSGRRDSISDNNNFDRNDKLYNTEQM